MWIFALSKPRSWVITSRLILLILIDLLSTNCGSFLFAEKQIMKHVQYKLTFYVLVCYSWSNDKSFQKS